MPMKIKTLSKYEDLRNRLRKMIVSGVYTPEQRLPSIQQMSEEYSLSKATVNMAVSNLAMEGLVIADRGRGIFVAPDISRAQRSGSDRIRIGLAFLDDYKSYADGGSHPVVLDSILGIEKRFEHRGCSLSFFVYPKGRFWNDGRNRLKEEILAGRVDGLLVAGPLEAGDVDALSEEGVPFALIGNVVEGRKTASVLSDITHGCRLLLGHLKEAGHQRVGLITYTAGQLISRLVQSFAAVSEELALSPAGENTLRLCNDEGLPDYGIVKTFFCIEPMPTAVVLLDEFIANHVISECLRRGIKIPKELVIACVTDMKPDAHVVPMTGLEWHSVVRRAMFEGAGLVMAMIEGSYVPPETTYVRPSLTIRESTAGLNVAAAGGEAVSAGADEPEAALSAEES